MTPRNPSTCCPIGLAPCSLAFNSARRDSRGCISSLSPESSNSASALDTACNLCMCSCFTFTNFSPLKKVSGLLPRLDTIGLLLGLLLDVHTFPLSTCLAFLDDLHPRAPIGCARSCRSNDTLGDSPNSVPQPVQHHDCDMKERERFCTKVHQQIADWDTFAQYDVHRGP